MAAQAVRGFTTMLPSEDSAWVGEELARRFGLPLWQLTLSATDANRFAIRIARALTRNPRQRAGSDQGRIDSPSGSRGLRLQQRSQRPRRHAGSPHTAWWVAVAHRPLHHRKHPTGARLPVRSPNGRIDSPFEGRARLGPASSRRCGIDIG